MVIKLIFIVLCLKECFSFQSTMLGTHYKYLAKLNYNTFVFSFSLFVPLYPKIQGTILQTFSEVFWHTYAVVINYSSACSPSHTHLVTGRWRHC